MNKKILVVDDDRSILEALQMMLEDSGYIVETISDGNLVKQKFQNLPDLILLDIWLSGMDGAEICKGLKKREQTKHVPIILISANRDTVDIAKKAGADDYIEKPFTMDDLLGKVERYTAL